MSLRGRREGGSNHLHDPREREREKRKKENYKGKKVRQDGKRDVEQKERERGAGIFTMMRPSMRILVFSNSQI